MRSMSLTHSAQLTYCPQFHIIQPKVVVLAGRERLKDCLNDELMRFNSSEHAFCSPYSYRASRWRTEGCKGAIAYFHDHSQSSSLKYFKQDARVQSRSRKELQNSMTTACSILSTTSLSISRFECPEAGRPQRPNAISVRTVEYEQ